MDTNGTRLLELAERIETAAQQARHELGTMRPEPNGYADRAYRDLATTLDRLRDNCDQIRYSLERDRLIG